MFKEQLLEVFLLSLQRVDIHQKGLLSLVIPFDLLSQNSLQRLTVELCVKALDIHQIHLQVE